MNSFRLCQVRQRPPMSTSTVSSTDNIAAARPLIKILRFIGLWQTKAASGPDSGCSHLMNFLYRIYRYLLHLPLTFTYIGLMWMQALSAQDLEGAGDVLYLSFTEAALVAKILNLWWQGASAWQFMHELAEDEELALRDDEERELWRRQHHAFGRVASYYIIGCVCTCTVHSLIVLLLDDYELPFDIYVPFDWHNPRSFWCAYCYEALSMGFNTLSNATLDITFCYFMFHVALLYKLIGLRLSRLKQRSEKDAVAELRDIFRLHKKVKRLTKQCESLVSVPILSQITLSALILCFSGYRMQQMRSLGDNGQIVAMLQYLGVMVLQIYLPCYYANEITVNSDILTRSVYDTDWLQFSVATRKLIVLYMEFLKRPVVIRAGGFFEVGLPIFTKTMNNAYSFFALLANMDK